MATQQDAENNRMIPNAPGSSASQSARRGAGFAESHGRQSLRPSEQRVEVRIMVLRADNVPAIKKYRFLKRKLFVTVSNPETTAKTADVPVERHMANWDQNLDPFLVQPSSQLTLRLYAKGSANSDILIGTHEMSIPPASQSDMTCVLGNGVGGAAWSTQSVTLHIRVNITPPTTSTKDPRPALDGADHAMKQMDRLDSTLKGAIGRVKWVMDTLSPIAEHFALAKMAHGLLLAIPKTILEQDQHDDNVQTLLRAIHHAFDFAHDKDTLLIKSIKPGSNQAKILTLMLQDVGTCCDFIQSYAKDQQFWKRTLGNIGGGPDKQIKKLSDVLVKRRTAFLDQATISTQITVLEILDDVAKISTQLSNAELDAIIKEIPHELNSQFSPDKGCLAGTRVAFLDLITDWVDDRNPDPERGLVLFGQAGTGKSSIAHEIARIFHEMNRLTSSFIFSRREQSETKTHLLFTTLARHLADRYPQFKIALGKVVKDNTDLQDGGPRDYRTLFDSLILEPLKGLHIVGPILVVIDALDESGDTTGRSGLPAFLADNLKRLPPNFRVVITSRPEHAIVSVLVKAKSVKIKYMDDPNLAAETKNDILTFLRGNLSTEEFGDNVEALAVKAEGLFQWAAVACQLILDPPERFLYDEKACIEHLLDPGSNRSGLDKLDELYKEVLEGYFKEKETRDLFRSVVGQLINSIEPLTTRSLITLRQHASYDKRDGAGILRRLGSLLSNVDSSDNSLPIIPLHTSFRDFLINEDKSGDFCVRVRDIHNELADSCLNLLVDPLHGLKFNICELETSYLANDDVKDLTTRVNLHISPALLYACRFWDNHLKHTDFGADLFGKVETLFKKNFLFWLEALSLTKNIGFAPSAFASLNMWLASSQGDSWRELKEFRSFVDDAAAFVRHFGMPMAKSAPHIYLSALPFAPTCSLVSTHYSTLFSRILHVELGQFPHWPSSEMTISNFGAKVNSVAFSPDGQHIVSGSEDEAIRVWNITTGEAAASRFTGHTGSVESVAFSPDGQHIVSGSGDETIHVWDAMTGETVAGPFTGHTSLVKSVTFSPDGQHIVSGSLDQTIRVWNAMTGETAAGPFTGHTDFVYSVAFSPDGQHIVSGSLDQTIRVWNATTGETAARLNTGYIGWVSPVAFSPDGQHIVSGSGHETIRVWDAMTGETVAGPFTGHTLSVESVAFSPDGQHIVSGSRDGTIRVWDAMTGETAAGPFAGHTDWVSSVAFSPDGQHIVSGSSDATIRVWNAMTVETAAGPFIGHTSYVESVAFSPDGQHIVSGSSDETIRVWNAMSGETAAGPFTGHTGSVYSVAFSPDGQYIVSGSVDETIRVWNAMTGETVAGPFTGHTYPVNSVAFSPDSQHIVSGSSDATIRVWNAMTGETVAGPFTGRANSVKSVAFSPDGQHIVSGSFDKTIRVWNAMTGETVAGPFTGHTSSVWSVAFSPDGQYIVSGSLDQTIRVWNAMTGETAAGPFTGHTDSVKSVAFSPDGQHIVSGSSDETIRVWNSMTGETAAGPFTGHTRSVKSVAFSPDGQYIVSGSEDRTIRVSSVTIGKTETTNDVDFTDHFMINGEGWICGAKGELLMWIPPVHREYLHRRSTIWISGKRGTRLNISNFVHGHSWTTCIDTQIL